MPNSLLFGDFKIFIIKIKTSVVVKSKSAKDIQKKWCLCRIKKKIGIYQFFLIKTRYIYIVLSTYEKAPLKTQQILNYFIVT